MKPLLILILSFSISLSALGQYHPVVKDSVIEIKMSLSAFGVESDDFPNIEADIKFTNDYSLCNESFYNPANKGSTYTLSKSEINEIRKILNDSHLETLKTKYSCDKTDQPTSTTTIYTTMYTYVISDYGLVADCPLADLYRLVYKIR